MEICKFYTDWIFHYRVWLERLFCEARSIYSNLNNFNISNIYFNFFFFRFETKEITNIKVSDGEFSIVDVLLNSAAEGLEEVIVTVDARQNTEASVLLIQKKSVSLLDGLSSQTFKKMGASNIANAVKQVPGVSVQGGKYVYVRGLGDRYSKSILNGIDIPGLDPDRNTIQMDLFATNLLSNILVIKSARADMPADFTGGVIDIITKEFPACLLYTSPSPRD